VKLANDGDFARARELHYQLLPLFKTLFIETNPIPVKYGVSLLGKCREIYRLPMWPMEEEKKRQMKKVLEDLGLIR